MPAATRNWLQAISQLMDGTLNLAPVFSHTPFTASTILPKAQFQFVHCVLPILQVLCYTQFSLPLHQRLVMLLWALPHLLLRVGPKDTPETVTSKILAASKAFQQGQWAPLIAKASERERIIFITHHKNNEPSEMTSCRPLPVGWERTSQHG
jgi:hypothetical protein